MTAGLPLINIILISLAKNVSIPFALSAGMPEADGAIQKGIDG